MFATQGLVSGDLDGLTQPAFALSNPAVVGGSGDGQLRMDDVLGLKLKADWVVLSACNTAAADGAGSEAVSGRGRAFFYAGTRALLATPWAVETESAQQLTTELFARQTKSPALSRAEALSNDGGDNRRHGTYQRRQDHCCLRSSIVLGAIRALRRWLKKRPAGRGRCW